MIIAIGCDHSAYDFKLEIIKHLKRENFEVIDVGCENNKSTHYPVYGFAVGKLIQENKADFGIVLCGTGIGIGNAAEKIQGVRCAICNNIELAKYARKHLNANVISCGARVNSLENIEIIIDTFLKTEYEKKDDAKINELDKMGFVVDVTAIQKMYDEYNMEEKENLKLPKVLIGKEENGKERLENFIENADKDLDCINLKFGNCNCCKSDKKFEN